MPRNTHFLREGARRSRQARSSGTKGGSGRRESSAPKRQAERSAAMRVRDIVGAAGSEGARAADRDDEPLG